MSGIRGLLFSENFVSSSCPDTVGPSSCFCFLQPGPSLSESALLADVDATTGAELGAAREAWAKADAYYFRSLARLQRLWEVRRVWPAHCFVVKGHDSWHLQDKVVCTSSVPCGWPGPFISTVLTCMLCCACSAAPSFNEISLPSPSSILARLCLALTQVLPSSLSLPQAAQQPHLDVSRAEVEAACRGVEHLLYLTQRGRAGLGAAAEAHARLASMCEAITGMAGEGQASVPPQVNSFPPVTI